jgi:hypothetical protein
MLFFYFCTIHYTLMKQIILSFIILLAGLPLFSQSFSVSENLLNKDVFDYQKGEKSFKISHSLSEIIDPGTSVSCNSNGIHYETSYYRVFDLENEFNINSDWIVEEVEVGIAQADAGYGASQPIKFVFYGMSTYTDQIIPDSLTQKGDTLAFEVLDSDEGDLVTYSVPPGVNVPLGQVLVVEVLLPDGHIPDQADNSLYIGSNDLGETDYTYIKAVNCGVPDPVHTADILYPDMHLIMNIYGQYENPVPEIINFEINGQIDDTEIVNDPDWTIQLTMLADADLTALSPDIQIPAGFQVIPASGEEVDFSQGPVVYEVNNEFTKVSQTWDVYVYNAGPDILDVILDGEAQDPDINYNNHTVTAYVPLGTDLTALSPYITVYDGFDVDPASGSEQDFSTGPVIYTVSHESMPLSQEWEVNVEEIEIVGVQHIPSSAILLSPNPANEYILIEGVNAEEIEIIDINGRTVHVNFHQNKITTNKLPEGLYIVKIYTGNTVYMKKIVICR